jgi:hypothetical protein
LGHFADGLAPFSPDGDRYGLVGISGDVTLAPKFLRLASFSEGVAAAQLERRKWGFLAPDSRWAIEPNFVQALSFSEGLACVTLPEKDRRGRKGYIDHSGEMVIPPRYFREASFHNGWALVEFEGRTQVIDKKGTVVWEC